MSDNLIPPFIMREAGVKVNDVPKIHVMEPSVEDHTISFSDGDLRIPLSLWGVFSYFITRAPTKQQVMESDEVYMLTPNGESWNPHTDAYARNEENMLDWEGNMVEERYRLRIILSDAPEDKEMASAAAIISVETEAIDRNLQERYEAFWPDIAPEQNGIEVSSIYDQQTMCSKMEEQAANSHFKMSIGATTSTLRN